MSIQEARFGHIDGREIYAYTLTNTQGALAEILTYGGAIRRILVPDRSGQLGDVTLGYDDLEGYVNGSGHLGVLVGRHANRIENAEFELNGTVYKLAQNDGKNHLHGGWKGFGSKIWTADTDHQDGQERLKLQYISEDGEENYPGRLEVTVFYSFDDSGILKIDYEAVSDRDTVVNLTNHAYFNLSGHDFGDITRHTLQLFAERYTPIDEESIPTGEVRPVQGTPLDFTTPTFIGANINSSHEQIQKGGGFDHNWILDSGRAFDKAAAVFDPESGRIMDVYTTKPGIQFYSGNSLKGQTGKDGASYPPRAGFCLETQYFPNALRHSHFPSPILRADEKYQHVTEYRFRTDSD